MPTTKTSPNGSPATLLRPAPTHGPCRQSSRPTLNQLQPNSSVDPFRVPTVFVVDDDAEMRESLELLLMAETFRVETYESADAFWEVFHPDRRGCVILDLRMPGMDGLELLERLAEHDHGLAVIVVSASADQRERVRAKELGAIDFLPKPYDTKKLLTTIREQLLQY
ncbi:MAG: response regulator [Planctomycetota bacterium]|nr:response regulator [Planctomycetota bacterium]